MRAEKLLEPLKKNFENVFINVQKEISFYRCFIIYGNY